MIHWQCPDVESFNGRVRDELLGGTQIYLDAPAFGVGAAFLLIAVGQAVGAPLIGILTDLTSQPTAFLIAAAAAAAAVVLKPPTTAPARPAQHPHDTS